MNNTVTCANCGQTWDVEHLSAGTNFTCQCNTIVCIPRLSNQSATGQGDTGPGGLGQGDTGPGGLGQGEVGQNTASTSGLTETTNEPELVEVVAPRKVTPENLAPIDDHTSGSECDPYSGESPIKPAMLHAVKAKPAAGSAGPNFTTSHRLRLVNHGVQLVLIGILISLLAMLLLAIPWSIALFVIIGVIQIGAGMVQIAGLICCLFAPPSSGARPYSIVALSCTASGSLMFKLIEMISSSLNDDVEATPLTMLALVAHMAGTAFFLFFLRKLALYTGQRQEAEEAMYLAIFMCVLAGSGMVLGMFIPVFGMATLILFVALFAAHLVWLFQFMAFLDKLKFRKTFRQSRYSTHGWSEARKE